MTMKISTAENFMRSAKAPTISAQVMPANVAWNAMNTISGMTTPLLNVAAVAKVPAIDDGFHTSVPGVFAVGNLVHPAETADVCALDGVRVAARVVDFLEHGRWSAPDAIAVEPPIAWASWTARGITLRVSTFVTGRVEVASGGRPLVTTRRRHLVPNRSITVPVPATASLDPATLLVRVT